MKRLIIGVLAAAGAAVLATGVLAAIEIVLAKPRARPREKRAFRISRTKSEVGYVYWVLEGFGQYKCYVLCDSWDEAVQLARMKLAPEGALV